MQRYFFVRKADDELYWVGELPLRRTGYYTADGSYVSGELKDAGKYVPEALAFDALTQPSLLTLPRPF